MLPRFVHFQCLSGRAEGCTNITLKTIRHHMLGFNVIDSSRVKFSTEVTNSTAPQLSIYFHHVASDHIF